MPGDPGPLVRRRQLGLALRGYRVQAGLSVTQAAQRLMVAPSQISRIETGQRRATLRDVRDLCVVYAVPTDAQALLMELAELSRQTAWWQKSHLDPAVEVLIGMEGAARSISEYEPLLIPGLLQTPDYIRAIVDTFYGAGEQASKQKVIDARLTRQHAFESERHPELRIVLDEAAVRRTVGGRTVMQKQLLHMADQIERISAELRIIPFSAGMHIGTLNGFVILDFDNPALGLPAAEVPAVVYVETLSGNEYYDQPADVERHQRAFAALQAAALPPVPSLAFLRGVTASL
ncbi:helix-turn-helix domain-containing protein [Actinoplanes sp. CA-030573]|uniref:helix-turn-helix domain-containing protein n=1 Tax=Actinoplanes sp. CA-030573 TaxID=3239898 RepID=UPI003D8AF1F7